MKYNKRKETFNYGNPRASKNQLAKAAEVYAQATVDYKEDTPPGKRLSVMEVSDHTCRWPIGDPHDFDFGFCGKPKPANGLPYCPHHTLLANPGLRTNVSGEITN